MGNYKDRLNERIYINRTLLFFLLRSFLVIVRYALKVTHWLCNVQGGQTVASVINSI